MFILYVKLTREKKSGIVISKINEKWGVDILFMYLLSNAIFLGKIELYIFEHFIRLDQMLQFVIWFYFTKN